MIKLNEVEIRKVLEQIREHRKNTLGIVESVHKKMGCLVLCVAHIFIPQEYSVLMIQNVYDSLKK